MMVPWAIKACIAQNSGDQSQKAIQCSLDEYANYFLGLINVSK